MPFPYQQTREVYSVPPEGGIPVNPTGYYKVPGLPYPATQQPARQPADPMDLLRDKSMDADAGVGTAPPRDPYMANLPPVPPKTPMAPPVTTLTPGRQTPFSRADAQALAALDPRALAEAKNIAAMPESTPAKITGSIGGKSFEMQPTARVDRNALARLYSQAIERQGQERQDAVRSQIQGGNERIAAIPGKSAVDLAKQQGSDKIGAINAEGAIQAPTRAANIAKSDAETAALGGKERRAQGEFDRTNDPKERQRAAAIDALAKLEASGFDKTPEGRKTAASLRALAGSQLPSDVAQSVAQSSSGTSPQDEFAAVEEFTASPEVARIIGEIQKNKQGMFYSTARRKGSEANRKALDSYIDRYAKAKGVDPNVLADAIQSQLSGAF